MGNAFRHPMPDYRAVREKDQDLECDSCGSTVATVGFRGDVEIKSGGLPVMWHFFYTFSPRNGAARIIETRATQKDEMHVLKKHYPMVYMFERQGNEKLICTHCLYTNNSKEFYSVVIPLAAKAYLVNADDKLLYNVQHPHSGFSHSLLESRQFRCLECSCSVDRKIFEFLGKTDIKISGKHCQYVYRFADVQLHGVYGFPAYGFDAIIRKSVPIIGMFEVTDRFYCPSCLPRSTLLDILVSFSDKIALFVSETRTYHLLSKDFTFQESDSLEDVTRFGFQKYDREGPDIKLKGGKNVNANYAGALLGAARMTKAISQFDTNTAFSSTAIITIAGTSTTDSAVNIRASSSGTSSSRASGSGAKVHTSQNPASPMDASTSSTNTSTSISGMSSSGIFSSSISGSYTSGIGTSGIGTSSSDTSSSAASASGTSASGTSASGTSASGTYASGTHASTGQNPVSPMDASTSSIDASSNPVDASTTSTNTSGPGTSGSGTSGSRTSAHTSTSQNPVSPMEASTSSIDFSSSLPDAPTSSTNTSDSDTKASGTSASDTSASGTSASGTSASDTLASDTLASDTLASDTFASGTSASGTSASGTPASGTPASGTPASGTPASGTPASGTEAPVSDTSASGTEAPACDTSASGTSASGTEAPASGTSASCADTHASTSSNPISPMDASISSTKVSSSPPDAPTSSISP